MDAAIAQVESVRAVNRYYTRRLGILTDHYLGQGRPQAEARLLFEIGDRADVRELLAPLSAAQRAELVTAQARVQRLLRLATVTVRAVDAGSVDGRHCLRAYAAELAGRFPEGYDDAALTAPGELTGDDGALLVAYEEERPVGCGASGYREIEPYDRSPYNQLAFEKPA